MLTRCCCPPAAPQSDVDEALRLMKVSQISIASDLEARERSDPISEMYLAIMAAAQRGHKSELSFDEVCWPGLHGVAACCHQCIAASHSLPFDEVGGGGAGPGPVVWLQCCMVLQAH